MSDDEPIYSDDLSDTPASSAAASLQPSTAHDIFDPVDAAVAVLDEHFKPHEAGPQSSLDAIVRLSTTAYVSRLDPARAPSPEIIQLRLLGLANHVIRAENKAKAANRTERQPLIRGLNPWQIAQLMVALHQVIRIAPGDQDTDREYDLLAMYEPSGRAIGTYSTSEDAQRSCARLYKTSLSIQDFKEVTAILREDAPRMTQCRHRDLIAVNNGIFFYGTKDRTLDINGTPVTFTAKSLHPFDPQIVFLSKSHVDYRPHAPNPIITQPDGSPWDVQSWVTELSDDPGMPELLWEIVGAIIRPHVRWGKTAWFYSKEGNNGKGTLCALMRNLCGHGAHTSIPLADFGKDFALEPLVRASAIIVDENDVGTYIDKAANLKAVVTNDVIQINRKYRDPIAYQFFGLVVQCLNEFPRVKDKSRSFYRRQLFVPFLKDFEGRERRWIKDDYLQRPEVLEHVLWYCLHQAGADTPGQYYTFSEPEVTALVLDEYKDNNDPVRAFWSEFRESYVWELLPFTFLYDHYKRWMAEENPAGTLVSNRSFIDSLVNIVKGDDLWSCEDHKRKIRPGKTMMATPEPIIHEFSLTRWMNPNYGHGNNVTKVCQPVLQGSYRGIVRTASTYALTGSADAGDDTTDDDARADQPEQS